MIDARPFVAALFVSLVVCDLSCSSEATTGTQARLDNRNEPARVSTGAQGQDVNSDTERTEQAETAIVWGSQFFPTLVVGFNDFSIDANVSPQNIQYLPSVDNAQSRVVRRGVSLMGWARSGDGGYTFTYKGKVSPPSGWSAIWGDPALAADSNNRSLVYYTQMGATDAAWNSVTGGADFTTESPGRMMVNGFCIARSTTGGDTFSVPTCIQTFPGAATIDRTAVAVDKFGRVYVAAIDQPLAPSSTRIRVWRSTSSWNIFTEITPTAFNGQSEPLLVTDNLGYVWLGSRGGTDESGSALLQRYRLNSDGGSGVWDSGIDLTDLCKVSLGKRDPAVLTGVRMRNAHSYNFAVGLNDEKAYAVRAVFQMQRPDGRQYVQVVERSAASPGACTLPLPALGQNYSSWSTGDNAGYQFMPNIETHDQNGETRWWVTYLTNTFSPSGDYTYPEASRIVVGNLAGLTHYLAFPSPLAPISWHVCPRVNDVPLYWGDYFASTQFRDLNGRWNLVSAFSDSRDAPPCGPSSDLLARPLHVAGSSFEIQ